MIDCEQDSVLGSNTAYFWIIEMPGGLPCSQVGQTHREGPKTRGFNTRLPLGVHGCMRVGVVNVSVINNADLRSSANQSPAMRLCSTLYWDEDMWDSVCLRYSLSFMLFQMLIFSFYQSSQIFSTYQHFVETRGSITAQKNVVHMT